MNIPEVKLGIIAVSRDCFPIALSTKRRQNIVAAYGEGIYECPITVENEKDALAALAGALVWLICHLLLDDTTALLLGSAVVIAIRLLAAHCRWSLPKARIPEE